ncbi:MAG: glycosyltransferase family 4 protein [Chitinivibrionia bacterium]|nr:glycosyltransferase family 4 protein [Chitinivibrionia bacterium]
MKKTIAIACGDITQLGGIERVVCNFSENLIEFGGYDVIIISVNSNEGLPTYNLSSKVKLIHLGIKKSKSLLKRCFSYIGAVKNICEICRKNYVDIIIGTAAGLNIILYFVKKKNLIKIACEHSNYDYLAFYASLVRRFVYTKLNAVVLLTQKDAENYNFCKNATVIPNTFFSHTKSFSDLQNNVVMSAGRFHKVKGFDLLIESVSLIKDKCADWKFKIFGDGDEKENLVKMVVQKNLENIIEIMPATKNIEKEYCKSSIYVLSSRHEPFGLVLLEAKSCGLPIVSFDCPNGPAEIIRDGIDGILVKNGDVEALSQAILKLIENPRLRRQYGQEAIKDVERFSPKRVFEMWEKLFADLIKER